MRLLHSPGGPAGANLDRTYRRLVDSSGEFTLRVQDAVGKVSGHLDRWRLHGYYQAV